MLTSIHSRFARPKTMRSPAIRKAVRAHRVALACGALMAGVGAAPDLAGAEVLPRPQVDYKLSAHGPEDARMQVAHSGQRLRLEVTQPGVAGEMTGIIDLARNRMMMLVALPGMGNRAFDVEVPPEFAVADLGGDGKRVGTDRVAGEPCDLWHAREERTGKTVKACITPDGITLRATAEVNGRERVVFEATELSRAPQDPRLFELPPGVKVTRLPAGLQTMVPGLPGILR